VSCRKNCKKWRHELFKSFKPTANSAEVPEGYNPFFRGGSKCKFRKKNCSTQWAWE